MHASSDPLEMIDNVYMGSLNLEFYGRRSSSKAKILAVCLSSSVMR